MPARQIVAQRLQALVINRPHLEQALLPRCQHRLAQLRFLAKRGAERIQPTKRGVKILPHRVRHGLPRLLQRRARARHIARRAIGHGPQRAKHLLLRQFLAYHPQLLRGDQRILDLALRPRGDGHAILQQIELINGRQSKPSDRPEHGQGADDGQSKLDANRQITLETHGATPFLNQRRAA